MPLPSDETTPPVMNTYRVRPSIGDSFPLAPTFAPTGKEPYRAYRLSDEGEHARGRSRARHDGQGADDERRPPNRQSLEPDQALEMPDPGRQGQPVDREAERVTGIDAERV